MIEWKNINMNELVPNTKYLISDGHNSGFAFYMDEELYPEDRCNVSREEVTHYTEINLPIL